MNKYKRILSAVCCAAVAAGSMALPVSVSADDEAEKLVDSGLDYDYARALQYSIYFYDANMCGTGVDENNRYSWRGDCHTYDAAVPLQPMDSKSVGTNLSQSFIDKYKDVLDPDGDGCVDVSGGFHDAGDHVEFGIPENYAAATLGWGYYEFRDSYVKTGQDDHIETILRYFNDYLMRCTFLDKNGEVVAHCYQVGDGDIDHAFWNSPEIDDMARPAFFLTAEKPQTDYVVSACGSLAINYLNFKDTDPEYAAESLKYAKALWKFANDHELQISDNKDGPKSYYLSSKWEDDYCWAAAWMYLATGDSSSLKLAAPYYDYYAPSGYCYNWNDMWGGTACLWGVINQTHPEINLVQMVRDAQGKNEYVFDNFWDEVYKCYPTWRGLETAGGYAFLSQWGSARYNTAMQLIGLVYDKYTNDGKPGEFSKWAKGQMEYIMGNNPLKRSYIVGYNENSAKFPHHRAASGLTKCEDTDEHRYVLYGALVGGPDGSDNHVDITKDYIYNEVTIDYNAAFVGACAGLYEFFGTPDMKATENFPPAVSVGGNGGSGGNDFWVDAYAVDDITNDGAGVTKLAVLMRTDSTTPKTDLSMRYYFSIKEFANKGSLSQVSGMELYDQAAVEASPADGVITSAPVQYNAAFDPDIYYVEVKWDGYKIANSNKKYQFTVGLYYGDKWDPSNDWSYQGITKCKDTYSDGSESRTDYICVYSDGVLVGGIEPDGSVPVKEETPTTAPTTKPTTKPTAAPTTKPTAAPTTAAPTTVKPTTVAPTEPVTAAPTEAPSNAGSNGDQPVNPTKEADVTRTLYGDADLSGEVTINDAVAVMSYVCSAKKYPIEPQGLDNADVASRGDGISNMDALAIQKYLAGIVDELPVE